MAQSPETDRLARQRTLGDNDGKGLWTLLEFKTFLVPSRSISPHPANACKMKARVLVGGNLKQLGVKAKDAVLSYFRGTMKHCRECGTEFTADAQWCRTCGSKRRKRSFLTRLIVFNASVGLLLLLILGILWYLVGLMSPELVERAIKGEFPFFTFWFDLGAGLLASLMPLILIKRFWDFLTT